MPRLRLVGRCVLAGLNDHRVDDSWPVNGVPTSCYGQQKAEVERRLDGFAREAPEVRVVRLRPGLTFKREAGSEIRRLFIGPLLPARMVRRGLIPVVPHIPGLRFQGVHTDVVGHAYRLALVRPVSGAFNIAAEPPLDTPTIARLLAAALSWRLRLQPTAPGWVDLAEGVPLMDTRRARLALDWSPRHTASDAFLEPLDGIRAHAGVDTPPLSPSAGGPLRVRELATDLGQRDR